MCKNVYRVTHVLVNMGWVVFDLGVKFPSLQAELDRKRNTQISHQPNPVQEQVGHPVQGDQSVYYTTRIVKKIRF